MTIIPEYVRSVMRELSAQGKTSYIVGGACRDMLLEKAPKDYDVATPYTPEEVIETLHLNYKLIPTGLKHGTVTVLTDRGSVEVTTFRKESGYSDKRRPDSVKFITELEEDLSRRDFTINAIAFDGEGFIDPFNGIEDIKNKVIRCVGDPHKRFDEDPLRILRALRFASVFEFEIEKKTEKAIIDNKKLLQNVSPERIRDELTAAVCGKGAGRMMLKYIDVLEVFLPELKGLHGFEQQNPVHSFDMLTHTAKAVDNSPASPIYRLAMMFHDVGKPHCFTIDERGIGHCFGHPKISGQLTRARMRQLRFDNKTIDDVCYLVDHHLFDFHDFEKHPEVHVRRALAKHGPKKYNDLLLVARADISALRDDASKELLRVEAAKQMADSLIEKGICFTLKELAVKGNDLLENGYSGTQIGNVLEMLLEKVSMGELKNDKPTLLKYLQDNSDINS